MGASISDKENEVYIVKNCGYNANINPGECVEFGMQIRKDNASELILPEKFKIPVTYLEVDKNKYSTDVVKVSDYEVRLDVKNLSKDVISGWNIEFESDMSINSTAEGEMKKHIIKPQYSLAIIMLKLELEKPLVFICIQIKSKTQRLATSVCMRIK